MDLDFLRPGPAPIEHCSKHAAEELAERIKDYWRVRGHYVEVAIECRGFHPAIRSVRWDVRSTLVDGLPSTARKTA